MKTTIKIHDTEWFKEHCKVTAGGSATWFELQPKLWNGTRIVHWQSGDDYTMRPLEGKISEVEHDFGNASGAMNNARYLAEGFYIPNWAIEWVKEEVK